MEFKELYKRPSGTYTMDEDGLVVRSKGLANNSIDECVRQHVRSFMSPSPRSDTCSLYSDDFEVDSTNGEDDIAAADRLLEELDDLLGDKTVQKNLNRPVGNNVDKAVSKGAYKDVGIDLSKAVGKGSDKDVVKGAHKDVDKDPFTSVCKDVEKVVRKGIDKDVHTAAKVHAIVSTEVENKVNLPTTKWNVQQPPVAVNADFGCEIKIPLPAAPEGLMAIKLPPLFQIHKQVDAAIQTLEVEAQLAALESEITESEVQDTQRTKRRNGFRKLMCGMCGDTEDDDVEEVDSGKKKSSKNCFQRMWKQLRKLF